MTDENITKRERQKQRRQAKVEAERARRRSARVRQLMTIGLLIVVVLVGIGVVVANQIADRRQTAARAEDVAARLDEVGCTPIETEDDVGGGQHISGQALAENDPETIYSRRPSSVGPHLGSVVASGAYDETIDERLVVHNLEHGYVTFWWAPGADAATVDALKTFVNDHIDEYPKLIAAPYNADLPEEQAVNIMAWTHRQECAEFDPDVALTFMDEHYGLAGDAPEKNLEPHAAGGQGVVDPAATPGPVLYPPLDTSSEGLPPETAPAGDATPAPTP